MNEWGKSFGVGWVKFHPDRRPSWLPDDVLLRAPTTDADMVDVAVFGRSGEPIVRLSHVHRRDLVPCEAPAWSAAELRR